MKRSILWFNLILLWAISGGVALNLYVRLAEGTFEGINQYVLVAFGIFTFLLSFGPLIRLIRKR